MSVARQVSAIEDFPEFGKFRVHLNCGHSILYAKSVDAISEYKEGQRLLCNQCGGKKDGNAGRPVHS